QNPAIVFFFGGGWRSGTPQQFYHHCQYFASQGMVAATADYRVLSRHGTPAKECVADGKSAVRYLRENAKQWGIDPERIVAAGGSAGGHVAACTGIIDGFESDDETENISSVPNAMILFNPALVLAPVGDLRFLREESINGLRERMGVEPRDLSPYHHVRKGLPPTLIVHGQADTTVPFKTAEIFADAMKQAGNDCTLVGYEDQPHGFFNYGRSGNRHYRATLAEAEKFLQRLDYLSK
ncbi:MAG: alpha/beta hydrolase, partial [Planctomycetales bacterium]|nr:alpha/beta hydrolase [Planctomycetales bacterium]